jgi:hypothetical protein
MLDLLILMNQRHGMEETVFRDVARATISQMHPDDREVFSEFDATPDGINLALRKAFPRLQTGPARKINQAGTRSEPWRMCDRLRERELSRGVTTAKAKTDIAKSTSGAST